MEITTEYDRGAWVDDWGTTWTTYPEIILTLKTWSDKQYMYICKKASYRFDYRNPTEDYLERTEGDDIKLIPKYRRYILRCFLEGACKPENTNFYQLEGIPEGVTLKKICDDIAKSHNLETACYIASWFVLYNNDDLDSDLTKPPVKSYPEFFGILEEDALI